MPSFKNWGWVLLGIGIIVIVAFIFLFIKPHGLSMNGQQMTVANTGQVISGFPQSLLLDASAQVTKSYSIGSGVGKTYVIEWNSSSSPTTLAAGYALALNNLGWSNIRQSDILVKPSTLYATGDKGTINLTATPQGSGSAVTLAYIPPDPNAASATAPTLPTGFPSFLNTDPAATLIAATSTGNSMIAIFKSQAPVKTLSISILAALKAHKWMVLTNQNTTSSFLIIASASSSRATITVRPGVSSAIQQLQINYTGN